MDRDIFELVHHAIENYSLPELELIIDCLRDHIDEYAEQFNQMDRDLGELH